MIAEVENSQWNIARSAAFLIGLLKKLKQRYGDELLESWLT